MVEENISQQLRVRKIDETKNCFLEEIKNNYLVSNKHKSNCFYIND